MPEDFEADVDERLLAEKMMPVSPRAPLPPSEARRQWGGVAAYYPLGMYDYGAECGELPTGDDVMAITRLVARGG